MNKPADFTMQDAMRDFTDGARIYIKDVNGRISVQLRINTLRPLMWFIFADGTGSIQPGYWDGNAFPTVKRVATQLLESGLAQGHARAKLELLVAFCEAEIEDRAYIGDALKEVQAVADAEFRALTGGRRGLKEPQ